MPRPAVLRNRIASAGSPRPQAIQVTVSTLHRRTRRAFVGWLECCVRAMLSGPKNRGENCDGPPELVSTHQSEQLFDLPAVRVRVSGDWSTRDLSRELSRTRSGFAGSISRGRHWVEEPLLLRRGDVWTVRKSTAYVARDFPRTIYRRIWRKVWRRRASYEQCSPIKQSPRRAMGIIHSPEISVKGELLAAFVRNETV